jgi:hypothetical protein
MIIFYHFYMKYNKDNIMKYLLIYITGTQCRVVFPSGWQRRPVVYTSVTTDLFFRWDKGRLKKFVMKAARQKQRVKLRCSIILVSQVLTDEIKLILLDSDGN